MASDKLKEWYFDVEMIIDHDMRVIRGDNVKISTHRILRCLSKKDLINLINSNNVHKELKDQITLNIRGVTL